MKTSLKNKKLLAVSLVIGFGVFSAITFKAEQIYDRIDHLESVIEEQAGEINQHESEIDELKAKIEDLESEIEDLKSER
jgi:peptidoglycan hydrolase CwlO-like protein